MSPGLFQDMAEAGRSPGARRRLAAHDAETSPDDGKTGADRIAEESVRRLLEGDPQA